MLEGIRLTQEEILKKIENHQHWLNKDCPNWQNMKADFTKVDLTNMNLQGLNLKNANFYKANLYGANLSNANLRNANFYMTNLRNANLYNADLREASFRNANLYNANLQSANLSRAHLNDADLRKANFKDASLCDATVVGDYRYTYIPMRCPTTGGFTAWKRAQDYIIKLFVPSDAERLSGTTNDCRCNKAFVLAIEELNGVPADTTSVPSDYDENFIYTLYKPVIVENFSTDRWREYTTGIHFFMERQEAINYKGVAK